MPDTKLARFLMTALLVVFCGSELWAQGWRERRNRRGWDGGGTTVGGSKSLFSVPRSQDDIHEWKQARTNIQKREFRAAVERLHELLRRGRRGVVPISNKRYKGLRTAVIETLRNMPKEGLEAYEKLAEREAGALAETAFQSNDTDALEDLAWRFPTSQAGRRARLRLGDLALEAGRGHAALKHYSALWFALAPSDLARKSVRQRMAATQALIDAGVIRPPDDDSLVAQVQAVASRKGSTVFWPSYGGGGAGIRSMDPPLSQLSARAQVPLPRTRDNMDRFAMHATGGLSGIYLTNGLMIRAIDPITRRDIWQHQGPHLGGEDYSINRNSALVCAVHEDVVVAALQVPNDTRAMRFRTHIELMFKIPTRRLFAVDRASGKLLWSHWDREEGPITRHYRGHDAAGPPLSDGDTIYCATQDRTGAIAYYLSAYDVRTGKTRWRSLICSSQGEVNMFGNARSEFAAGPLAIADGVVYGSTNLGICYAADARTGRVRWASTYPIIPLPKTQLTRQMSRAVVFANNPVVISHGVMVTTPLDSDQVLGFDADTGKLLWKMDYVARTGGMANNIKWVLGVMGDEVILSGTGVVAVKLRAAANGQRAQPRSIRDSRHLNSDSRQARGAIAGTHIYYPSASDIRVFNESGIAAPHNPIPFRRPGNLLMADGILIGVRNDLVTTHCNVEALLHDAERRIQKDPNNPNSYLHLATLLSSTARSSLAGSRGARAIKMLKRGLGVARERGLDKTSPVYKRLAQELFAISLTRGRGLMKSAPDQALTILRRARDESATWMQWLQAHELVLALSEASPKKLVIELDRMAATHGDRTFAFTKTGPQVGTVSVRAYALWRSVPHVRPIKEAARRCQVLLQTYGTVDLDGETARDFAVRTLAQLIKQHGRGVYADIEVRARAALASAAGDSNQLRRVELLFPHSKAAQDAMTQRLDVAVRQGDLAGVAQIYRLRMVAGEPSAGMLRRLMVAAERANNRPLARALALRIVRRHGGDVSDYPADRGRKLRDIVRVPGLLRSEATPSLELPAEHLGKPIGGISGETTELLRWQLAPGFKAPPDVPLYTIQDVDTMQAYDLQRSSSTWDKPMFPAGTRHQIRGRLTLCGTMVVVPEYFSIHGLHYRNGKKAWSFDTQGYQDVSAIGVSQGVLHVYTKHVARDDSELLGIEPLTGTIMFRHNLNPLVGSAREPKSFLNDLWVISDGKGSNPVVLRLDGLTGRIKSRTAFPSSLVKRLDLPGGTARSLVLDHLQRGLLVDEGAIYICRHDSGRSRTPFIVALRHTGGQRWTWNGQRGSRLERCGLHEAGLVVVESRGTQGAVFALLDKQGGTERRKRSMRGVVQVANWPATRFVGQPDRAPDQVLLTQEERSLSIVCMSLTDDVPSFRYQLPIKNREIEDTPQIGKDFLAIPVVAKRGNRRGLFVIDLKRRRGALPGGRNSIPLSDTRTGFRLARHGKYVLYQAETSIYVLGKGNKGK